MSNNSNRSNPMESQCSPEKLGAFLKWGRSDLDESRDVSTHTHTHVRKLDVEIVPSGAFFCPFCPARWRPLAFFFVLPGGGGGPPPPPSFITGTHGKTAQPFRRRVELERHPKQRLASFFFMTIFFLFPFLSLFASILIINIITVNLMMWIIYF